ncbi:MAG TPA: hypothetical protein VNA89_02500 [Gemmatimonadaceae bacterium]|nr:hypothetical protein [Gemmatimonadaceae bacterium]
MLGLYCTDGRQLEQLRKALPAGETVLATDAWSELEQAAPGAACLVVVAKWLSHDGVFPQLCALRVRSRFKPVVLVTSKDADNARSLKDVHVEEVVWCHEAERELWPAVKRAAARGLLRQLGDRFEMAPRLAPLLRGALAHACRSERPVTTVEALAAAAHCDRRTLWYQWQKAFHGTPPLRLEDALNWLILLRAAGRYAPGRAWPVVAAELDVHEHTLARLTVRLAGITLRELSTVAQGWLVGRFAERVLTPLLGGDDLDVLR